MQAQAVPHPGAAIEARDLAILNRLAGHPAHHILYQQGLLETRCKGDDTSPVVQYIGTTRIDRIVITADGGHTCHPNPGTRDPLRHLTRRKRGGRRRIAIRHIQTVDGEMEQQVATTGKGRKIALGVERHRDARARDVEHRR